MPPYGRGQMLGSGINPESFKQDYSGFANAAAMQAQGLSNLGDSISGAAEDYFKKQKENEQKVQKSLSVAKAIGDLIPGLKPTIQDSLNILNDKELPLSQRTAEADAIADILNLSINEVRNRQDVGFKERELGIREAEAIARMAPPVPEPFRLEDKVLSVAGGDVLVKQGNDGQTYDPSGQYPVYDLGSFLEGQPPEVYSNPNRAGFDPATGIDELSSPEFDGGVLPAIGDIPDPSSPRVSSANSRLIKEAKKDKVFRRATPEEATAYGATAGQIDEQTGRFYPVNLPSGMTVESDGQGGIKVVQGAGVGTKNQNAAEAREKQQSGFVDEFIRTASETIELLPNIPDNPVGAKVGTMFGGILPGTEQGRVVSRLNTLKANLALDKVNQMRAASPTGGAAGNMTEKEWPLFMQEFGTLDASENKQDLEARLKNASVKLFNRVNGTPEERKSALEKGKITKEQDEIVQKQYDEMLSTLGMLSSKPSGRVLESQSQDIYKEFGIE